MSVTARTRPDGDRSRHRGGAGRIGELTVVQPDRDLRPLRGGVRAGIFLTAMNHLLPRPA